MAMLQFLVMEITVISESGLTRYQSVSTGAMLWNMVNQRAEVIGPNTMLAVGDAAYRTFEAASGFNPPVNNDGVFGVNHVMRFRSTGQPASIRHAWESRVTMTPYLSTVGEIVKPSIHNAVSLVSPAGSGTVVCEADIWIALTKPFSPKAERSLKELPEVLRSLEWNELPADAPTLVSPEAYAVEGAGEISEYRYVFGLSQTDLYQHVYTLEYFRIADGLAVQHLAKITDVSSLYIFDTMAYFRKPFHAGVEARVEVEADRKGDVWSIAVRLYHPDRNDVPSVALLLHARS